jgi:O-antigen ligase
LLSTLFTFLQFYKKIVVASLLFIATVVAAIFFQNIYVITIVPFVVLLFFFVVNKIQLSFLYWVIIFFLPLSTELQITPSLGLDFPDEPLLLVFTFLFIAIAIATKFRFVKPLAKSTLFLIVFVGFIWSLVTSFFSTNVLISLKYCAAKIWYIIPFLMFTALFISSLQQLKKIGNLFIVSMSFIVAQSIVRHSFYSFGFDGIKYSLSPFFRNHVNYSSMLVCILPLAIFAIFFSKKRMYKLVFFAVSILLFTGLVLSYSRGAWLAAMVGIFMAIIIKYNQLKLAIIVGFISVAMSTFWLQHNNNYLKFAPNFNTTIFHENFTDHLQATVNFTDVSNAERLYRWVAGSKLIAKYPITGVGPNNFYSNYKSEASYNFKTWVSNNNDHSTIHNYFLLIAAEQGIFGLILFVLLLVYVLLLCQKMYHQFIDTTYKNISLLMAIILAIICSVNFINDLIETDKIGSLFYICLGIVMYLQKCLLAQKKV